MKDDNISAKVTSIRGQIVEVKFEKDEPNIGDILLTQDKSPLRLEVYASSGPNSFYCLSLGSADRLSRGQGVVNTGKPIQFPVGPSMLGRAVNLFGEPLDSLGEIKAESSSPIHRSTNVTSKVLTDMQIM